MAKTVGIVVLTHVHTAIFGAGSRWETVFDINFNFQNSTFNLISPINSSDMQRKRRMILLFL